MFKEHQRGLCRRGGVKEEEVEDEVTAFSPIYILGIIGVPLFFNLFNYEL